MMRPASLRCIAKTAIVRFLVCTGDASFERDVICRQLQSNVAGLFCENILEQILDDFPQELTDELLVLLAPPRLHQLKLTRCDKLTVKGLNNTIHKCDHIQFLDFSKCVHLLHPSMFCCLKEKAFNLTAVSLEESELVTDDVVQVLLLCCPGLQHLNLSSCKNITDLAFAVRKPHDGATPISSQHACKAGRNLTSVDISGCQSLSSVALKHLVELCGPSLTSVNLAWTGVGCLVLLLLAGLSFDAVKREVLKADPSCTDLVELFAEDHNMSDCDDGFGEAALVEWNKNQTPTGAIGETFESVQLEKDSALSECEDKMSNWNQGEGGAKGRSKNTQPEEDAVLMIQIDTELRDWKGCGEIKEEEESCKEHCIDERDIQMAIIDEAIQEWDNNKAKCDVCETEEPVCQVKREVDLTNCMPSKTDEPYIAKTDEGNISNPDKSIVNPQLVNDPADLCEVIMSNGVTCSGLPQETGVVQTHSEWESLESTYLKINAPPSQTDNCHVDDVRPSQSTSASCPTVVSSSALAGSVSVKEACPERLVAPGDVRVGFVFHGEGSEYSSTRKDKMEDEYYSVEDSFVNICNSHSASSKPTFNPEEGSDTLRVLTANEAFFPGEYSPTFTPEVDNGREEGLSVKGAFIRGEHNLTLDPTDITITNKPQEVKTCSVTNCSAGGEETRMDLSSVVPCPTKPQPEVYVSDTEESNELENTCIVVLSPDICTRSSSIRSYQATSDDDKGSDSTPDAFAQERSRNVCEPSPSGMENSPDSTSVHRESALPDSHESNCLMDRVFDSKITSLDISSIHFHSKPLGSACLKVFSQNNTCLKRLSLSWTELDDKTLSFVLQHQPQLESLSVVDCESLTSSSLLKIPTLCPSLSHVDLKGVYHVMDSNVCPLVESRHMVSLSLAEAPITDITLKKLGENCANLLTELDFSWCEEITDVGMAMVVESCPNLRCLGLRQCSAANSTLNKLASHCHHMTSLNISGVHHLDDEMVNALATNMSLLVDVDLSWNSSLTDKAVYTLLSHCTRLTQAGLSGLKLITSKPFLGIMSHLARWHLVQEVLTYKESRTSKDGQAGSARLRTCDAETAKTTQAQVPFRSLSYAPSLRHLTLEYSDRVNDDHLSQIVCVCRGTLYIRDYYGQPIEPKWVFL